MARRLEVFLHVDFVVAKRGLGLAARGAKGDLKLAFVFGHLHAAPATARGGLDDDRVAHRRRLALGRLDIGHRAFRARHARNAELFHRILGGDLVAHDADMLGGGADEGDAVVFEHLHESRVFRQEPIAGVDRLRAGDLAGRNDGGH